MELTSLPVSTEGARTGFLEDSAGFQSNLSLSPQRTQTCCSKLSLEAFPNGRCLVCSGVHRLQHLPGCGERGRIYLQGSLGDDKFLQQLRDDVGQTWPSLGACALFSSHPLLSEL